MIASGLSTSDRVVTTGFANLADGSKIIIGRDDQTPQVDLAPRKRGSRNGQAKDQSKDAQPQSDASKEGQAKPSQGKKDWPGRDGEYRRRSQGEGGSDAQGSPSTPAKGSEQSSGAARPQQ